MEQDPEDFRGLSWRRRVRKGDKRKFRKLVDRTKIEGLRHIFLGTSKIRRSIWSILFLTALAFVFYTIIDHIIFLASKPTATTISLQREQLLRFPAVTICSLNPVSQMYSEERNLLEFLRNVVIFNDSLCMQSLENATVEDDFDFYTLLREGRHPAEDLFLDCQFEGEPCTPEDFLPTITRLGFCYTFNSGRNGSITKMTDGSGTTHGLELILNISQGDYIGSRRHETGVKIAIHQQGVPGEPDDIGIAVPPGRNGFISLRERVIINEARNRKCQDNPITYNFLREEYDYSASACVLNCFFRNIANNCSCIEPSIWTPPNQEQFAGFSECGREDSCCVSEQYYTHQNCQPNCPQVCSYTAYSISTSYSAFPPTSRFQQETLGRRLGLDLTEFNDSYLQDNLLAVNIYFEDLNVERETTKTSYTIVSLLADIGGQLGLFIGAGILTIIELCIWMIDEIKDRCCGVSERKLSSWFRTATRKRGGNESYSVHNPAVAELGNPVGPPPSYNQMAALDVPLEDTNSDSENSGELGLEGSRDDSNQAKD